MRYVKPLDRESSKRTAEDKIRHQRVGGNYLAKLAT